MIDSERVKVGHKDCEYVCGEDSDGQLGVSLQCKIEICRLEVLYRLVFELFIDHLQGLSKGDEVVDCVDVEASGGEPDAEQHVELEFLEESKHEILTVWLLALEDLDVVDRDECVVLYTLLHDLLSEITPRLPLTARK